MKHDMTFYGSVTIGERGQVVVPSDAREELGLKPGDKLLAFKAPMGEGVVLAKPEAFEKHLADMNQHINSMRQRVKKEK